MTSGNLLIYKNDAPIASIPITIEKALIEREAVRYLRLYSEMYPAAEVRAALRTEEGHVLVGPAGILIEEEF